VLRVVSSNLTAPTISLFFPAGSPPIEA